MKPKIISSVMIASLLASMLLVSMVNTGSAEYWIGAKAKFYMRFTKKPDTTTWWNATGVLVPGMKYNVTVGIANVTQMIGYGVTFVWNSTFMSSTGKVWLSDFFKAERDNGSWSSAKADPGYPTNNLSKLLGLSAIPPTVGAFCDFGQTALGPAYNVTGTFDIVTLEFVINTFGPEGFYLWKNPSKYPMPANATNWPQPYLQEELAFSALYGTPYWLTECGWKDTTGLKQPYDVVWCSSPLFAPPAPLSGSVANCVLWISPPAPFAPVAHETLSTAFPLVNQTVTVTVIQDSPGFDGAALCPITSVTIDYGDGVTNTSAFTPPSIAFWHKWAVAGPYTIHEYCYAAGMAKLGPLAWCNFTSSLTVIALAVTGIDVFEVRHPLWPGDTYGTSGNGTNIPGRPYDPQALVVLEAYVIYGGDPVQCKIVEFQINVTQGPYAGTCILFRTCQTDANGIARIEFRIPELCYQYGGPTALFGKWFVYAAVSMCEVKYNDTMLFDVGYILTLSNMVAVSATVKKCEYVNFTVDISNIDWVTVPYTIILVVYDNNEVPIGQEILTGTVPGEKTFCNPYKITVGMTLHIPKYAYVGASTGYINLFTNLPALCGLAYCPEVSVGFIILKT